MSDLGYQLAVRDASGRGAAEDWFRLGCVLSERLRRWGAAVGCFARSVEREPESFRALCNLGWNLHLAGRSEEGREWLRRAVELAPGEGTPHALLSQVELLFGRVGEAVFHGREAVRLEPQLAINHVALSFALMEAGEWAEGWREYENRFFYKIPEFTSRPYRLWRGERVKRLYLEAEQGAGDCIFALRWLPMAAACAERVVLYVHQSLYSLVLTAMRLPGNVEVYPLPRPLPVADAWCPLMSLPAALEKGEPWGDGPYLVLPGFDDACRDYWGAKDPAAEREAYGRFRRLGGEASFGEGIRNVAICWSGSPEHEQAHHRDCALVHFLRLAEIPGVRLHSVQMGAAQGQFGDLGCWGLIEDRSPEITNFLDTAKVLGEMDLLVTVDTAVAHLAGALGMPCWLLLNRRGQDFRWGPVGETTGWYPSLWLWRRQLGEGWGEVLERVAAELRGSSDGGGVGDRGATAGRAPNAGGIGGGGSSVPVSGGPFSVRFCDRGHPAGNVG